MSKITLDNVASGYDLSKINTNFQTIQTALDNTVSRDGTLPNSIGSDIDMNGNSFINVDSINGADAAILEDMQAVVTDMQDLYDSFDDRYLGSKTVEPTVDNDGLALLTGALYFNEVDHNTYVWTGSAWRKFNELSIVREELTALEGQTEFILSTVTYTPGISGVFVYIDGVRQFDTAYTETDSTTITLSEGVPAGTKVMVETGAFSAGLILNNASAVSCTPVGGISSNTVQAALQELDTEKLTNNVSATSTLLGRRTAGAGVVEEIGLTSSGLSISGSNLLISSIPSAATATTQTAGDNSTKVATTAYADAQTGTIVQVVEATPVVAVITCNVAVPFDNTIPQNTEGTQVITATITPTSATNRLRIEFLAPIIGTVAPAYSVCALFQDSEANAIAMGGGGYSSDAALVIQDPLSLVHEMAAGTTSATTFKIRAGASGGTTLYINGNNTGTRLFGGISAARLSITEVRV